MLVISGTTISHGSVFEPNEVCIEFNRTILMPICDLSAEEKKKEIRKIKRQDIQ